MWWVVWAALMISVCINYIFLARTSPTGATSPGWPAALVPFFLGTVVRWAVLPRMENPQRAWAIFLVGMALEESLCFLGLFIFPARQLELAILSEIGMVQFIPVFAKRFRFDA